MAGVETIDENVPLEDSKAVETSETKSAPETRRVHWYTKVQKKRHVRIVDFSPEEKAAVWYTEADSKLILAMAKVTVKMIMKDEHCDDIDYCKRGLEGKTPSGSKRRQKNKLKVRRAVLEEQDIQREEGVPNPEFLAEVSRSISKPIVMEAHKKALEDERNIRDYLNRYDTDSSPIQPTR